jgi:hypothetical protein
MVALAEDGLALRVGQAQDRARAVDRLSRAPNTLGEYPPVYLWLDAHGGRDVSLAMLEARATAARVPYDFLRLRPEFTAVAADPRFVRALAASRGHFDRMLATMEQARARGEFPAALDRPLREVLQKLGMPTAGR